MLTNKEQRAIDAILLLMLIMEAGPEELLPELTEEEKRAIDELDVDFVKQLMEAGGKRCEPLEP